MMHADARRLLWLVALLVLALGLSACREPSERATSERATSEQSSSERSRASQRLQPGQSDLQQVKPLSEVNLVDATSASQIDFVHRYEGHDERYIVEAVGSGLATLDYDADGYIDIYFLNGAAIPVESGPPMSNALYRNLGAMRFADVTSASHAEDLQFSMGVAVADYDNDGFSDLYITNFGQNKLLRNNGDGTFAELAVAAGVQLGNQLGAGACFLDADGDGQLDLFVGNYVRSPVEKNIKRTTEGFPSYPGPLDFETDADWLFHNNGDGTFTDISEGSGIGLHSSTSMGCVAADFDEDGDTDIVMVNDVDRNFFFENDGTGRFAETGIQRGIAFSRDGKRNGNMGIDTADVDGDGLLDLFTTTFSNELPVLYKNLGDGYYADETVEQQAGLQLLPHANWGVCFLDVDNDRDVDLFIANGHTDRNVHRWAYTTDWKVANALLLNDGTGRFVDVSAESGSALAPVESSRGVAAEDFDFDGDLDLIILNALAPPTLVRNDTAPRLQWLQVDLKGTTTNRDGVGARAIVTVDGIQVHRVVLAGRGYQSGFGQRLHFGLGNADSIDTLEIRWPDGSKQTVTDLEPNQLLTIVQQ